MGNKKIEVGDIVRMITGCKHITVVDTDNINLPEVTSIGMEKIGETNESIEENYASKEDIIRAMDKITKITAAFERPSIQTTAYLREVEAELKKLVEKK